MDRSGALTPISRQAGSVAAPRLSPNGERVVFGDEQGNVKMTQFNVVFNWFEELERLVPKNYGYRRTG